MSLYILIQMLYFVVFVLSLKKEYDMGSAYHTMLIYYHLNRCMNGFSMLKNPLKSY